MDWRADVLLDIDMNATLKIFQSLITPSHPSPQVTHHPKTLITLSHSPPQVAHDPKSLMTPRRSRPQATFLADGRQILNLFWSLIEEQIWKMQISSNYAAYIGGIVLTTNMKKF